MNTQRIRKFPPRNHGFTRTELMVSAGATLVILVLVFLFLSRSGSAGKNHVCFANLKALGTATQMYSQQNGDKLPYAYIHVNDHQKYSWDTLIRPYARAAMRGDDPNNPAPGTNAFNRLLLCPQDDTAPRDWGKKQGRRTYSMPWHDMEASNWPPGGDNKTGIGIWWRAGSKGISSLETIAKPNTKLPSLRLAGIPNPAGTMLLAEQSRSNNIVANSSGANIRCTADHVEGRDDRPAEPYHDMKLNYLMLDGHVELLLPAETVGAGGAIGKDYHTHQGLWTINPND